MALGPGPRRTAPARPDAAHEGRLRGPRQELEEHGPGKAAVAWAFPCVSLFYFCPSEKNKQKERLERRHKRIKDEDDRKNAIHQASLQEAAEERRKRIEEAKRMLLFEKDDIHQVNSSFVFSEILHERSKQIEFNEHLKKIEEDAKKAKAEQIKCDVEAYHEEELKRKERQHVEKMERKAENIKMMKEKAEREALLLAGEKAYEQQDIAEMEKEIKQVQENIEREISRKKELVKKNALESIEMSKERKRIQKQEEEDEEKVIQIYLKIKQRMECMRKKREAEAKQAKLEHQERIRAIIAESLKEKEDDIEGMIAKALKEKDEREAKILQKRKNYEAKLLKERQEYNAQVKEQKMKDEKEEKELKQWILMQGLRRDEIDKLHEMKRKESEWATKMVVREGYNKQIEEHREIKNKQCADNRQRHEALLGQIKREDEDFFDYAEEVLNECKIGGRPLYPIKKTIHEYRKKHGIINREKYEKWAKEMAEQERRYQEEDEAYNRQLSITDETPQLCRQLFPPLLKKCPL
ncbi:cilia- and flagella- associated protein 210-like isoform X2 [Frankliniella occidentalis]|uniref:Cilia- and flagella- associated protein 210-like isoform X2 n=1 Tax=Frankliniella occidentalis TaxID=133901 RepID=A0A9C6X361_FRAOC|nr:cilia- and flagella- associated protein 210-like isoform X2 [Frankliniella occidentalis]